MSIFFSPMAGGGTDWAASLDMPLLVTILALLILVSERAMTTNVSAPGFRRLSHFLDVGIAPLAIVSLLLAATKLARILDPGA